MTSRRFETITVQIAQQLNEHGHQHERATPRFARSSWPPTRRSCVGTACARTGLSHTSIIQTRPECLRCEILPRLAAPVRWGGWLRHDNRLGSDARTWCPNAPQIGAGAITCKRNLFVQATITAGDGIYIAEPPAARPRKRAHSARGEASRAGAAEHKNDRYIAYERTTRSQCALIT